MRPSPIPAFSLPRGVLPPRSFLTSCLLLRPMSLPLGMDRLIMPLWFPLVPRPQERQGWAKHSRVRWQSCRGFSWISPGAPIVP